MSLDVSAPVTTACPINDELPPLVLGNVSAASVRVVTTLAQDTVVAAAADVPLGVNTVALFANPFVGGLEEQLFVNTAGVLSWLRHVVVEGEAPGWQVVGLGVAADEVVVAVHPDGSVWAFVVVAGGESIRALRLERFESGPGVFGARWVPGVVDLPSGLSSVSRLSVQYVNDRPPTAYVYFFDTHNNNLPTASVYQLTGRFSVGAGASAWSLLPVAQEVDIALVQPDATVVCGMAGGVGSGVIRVYTRVGNGDLFESVGRGRRPLRTPYGVVTGLAGVWNARTGVGCVFTTDSMDGPELVAYLPGPVDQVEGQFERIALDAPLERVVAWQDLTTRLHVYGVYQGVLRVVHDLGPHRVGASESQAWYPPTWETHEQVKDGAKRTVATSRALFADVVDFYVDGFPGEYPAQQVLHGDSFGPEPERRVIYTQDVASSWWAVEKVRLPAATTPYLVSRYQSQVTVLNSYGSPVPQCPVTLTAERVVDVEIAGRFYRTGPDQPVKLVTDFKGEIILRVLARALTVPTLHLDAAGMPNGVAINPVANVQAFLGGEGTLPNHSAGISAAALQDAKTPDGDWLVPAWHGASTLTVTPTPDQIATWFNQAYRAGTGQPQNPVMVEGLADPQPVIAFGIQTWDPNRPAHTAYTSNDQLDAAHAALLAHPAYGGWWEDFTNWVGDVWQGITDTAAHVWEVVVHTAEHWAEITLQLIDGVIVKLRMAWDSIVDIFHFVEAVWNAIKAAIIKVIDWLKWLFDFNDVIATKDLILTQVRAFPKLLHDMTSLLLDDLAKKGVSQAEHNLEESYQAMRSQLTGKTMNQDSLAVKNTSDNPALGRPDEVMRNPHTTWMNDQIVGGSVANPAPADFVPSLGGLDADIAGSIGDLLNDLINAVGVDAIGEDLRAACAGVGDLLSNLFRSTDTATFARQELVALLDIFHAVLSAGLHFADHVIDILSRLVHAAADLFLSAIDTPVSMLFPGGWLQALWSLIVGGTSAEGSVLTVGDLAAMLIAFPATMVSKAVLGRNLVPQESSDPVVGSKNGVANELQWAFQLIVAVGQGGFFGVDLYMDWHLDVTALNVIFGVGDLILFGPLAAPSFYDTLPGTRELFLHNQVEFWWWIEWGMKALVYIADFACAMYTLFLPGSHAKIVFNLYGNELGYASLFVLGFLGACCSGLMYAASRRQVMDQHWLACQLLGEFSTLTAWPWRPWGWRALPQDPVHPHIPGTLFHKVILVGKSALDAVADITAGIYLFTIVCIEMGATVNQQVAGGSDVGSVGAEYPLGLTFSSSTPYSPYTWTLTGAPRGLYLDGATAGTKQVQLAGVPLDPGPYTLTVTCEDDYSPAKTVTVTQPITVTGPPWEPDPESTGAVIFYDKLGNVLVHGADLTHLADYLAVTTDGTPGTTEAQVFFAAPDPDKATAGWTETAASASTPYPNAQAPAQIAGPGFANPVVSTLPADLNLLAFIASLPSPSTKPGYANRYQVRVYDSGGSTSPGSRPNYWETDIELDPTAGTWSVICPLSATPAVTLAVTPSTPPPAGTEVVFDVTVDPAYAGSVQLYNNGGAVGSAIAVTPNGRAFWNVTPAVGANSYLAQFVPQGGQLVVGAQSAMIAYVVPPAGTLVSQAPALLAGPYRPG